MVVPDHHIFPTWTKPPRTVRNCLSKPSMWCRGFVVTIETHQGLYPKNSASGRLWRFFEKRNNQSKWNQSPWLARKRFEKKRLSKTQMPKKMNSDCLWSCFCLLKTFYENKMSTHHALMQGRFFMSRSPQFQDQTFNEAVAIPPLIICFRAKGTVRNHGGFVIWDANTQWNMIIRLESTEKLMNFDVVLVCRPTDKQTTHTRKERSCAMTRQISTKYFRSKFKCLTWINGY